jgi:hypothetical protein
MFLQSHMGFIFTIRIPAYQGYRKNS